MRTRKMTDRMLLEGLVNKYGVKRLTNVINKMNEGVYGPTGAEARRKLQSPECVKYQEILDEFNEIGLKEFPKYFHKFEWTKVGTLYVRLPEVSDGETRRLCRHLEYDDIFIHFPGTTLYYVINRDDLFNFKVSYTGHAAGTKVAGESFHNTAVFGPRTARFFYDVIKALNPNTKVKLSDLEAD